MEIIKNREIVEDGFVHLGDDEPLPDSGNVTVSLARWKAEPDRMRAHPGEVGVRLRPADEPDALVEDLDRIALVAVEFPKFTDGRGYSIARRLRERFGYRGELRATGHVLRDQLFYMHRCGFDAFEIAPGKSVRDALEGLADFSVTYQAAADEPRPLYRRGLR
jgi:uncharacterized protein (DUF934 family)